MNCQCILALLFFINLVTTVSGTIVQADHYMAMQIELTLSLSLIRIFIQDNTLQLKSCYQCVSCYPKKSRKN
jgi:hypothetical protein